MSEKQSGELPASDFPVSEGDAELAVLREHATEIRERFAVEALAVFGSVSRGALRADSDVDMLVRFREPTRPEGYFGLKDYLEGLLGRPVDLATESMLKPRLRERILDELTYVA